MRSFTACCTDLHDGLHADTWTATSFRFQCQKGKCSPGIMTVCRTGDAELEMQDGGLRGAKCQAFVFWGSQWDVRLSFKNKCMTQSSEQSHILHLQLCSPRPC